MEELLISIIIPVYNTKEYLAKCLESVLNQTYCKIEVILIDDGSTDGSDLICDEYAQKDSRIKTYHIGSQGVLQARRFAGKCAKGKYVIALDSDDWIDEKRIENLVSEAVLHDADMIYLSGCYFEYESHTELVGDLLIKGVYSAEEAFSWMASTDKCFERKVFPSLGTWAIKTEIYKKVCQAIDCDISIAEDQMILWLCLMESTQVSAIEEASYHYLQRASSLTHATKKDEIQRLRALYYFLKKEIERHHKENSLMQRLVFMITRAVMFLGYDKLLISSGNVLFPYEKIEEGSEVVIYGAGSVGKQLIENLMTSGRLNVVGCVDKYEFGKTISDVFVRPIEEIKEMDYTYIVIAINAADTAEKVKKELLDMGIDGRCIRTMSATMITQNVLERCFENER